MAKETITIGETTVVIDNAGATRNLPASPALIMAVASRVEQAYGPGYTLTLMSAGQGKAGATYEGVESKGRVGSTQRHDYMPGGAIAADFTITSPDGRILAGAALDPLANLWIGIEGGMGINQKPYDGSAGSMTHLDLVGGQNPFGRPAEGKEGNHWYYDKGASKYRWNEAARDEKLVRALGFADVKEYQDARGLDADGVIGPKTRGALYADVAGGKAPGMEYRTAVARAPIELSPIDRDIAIRTVIGEAIGEGPEGMAAAAHVIANRFDQGFGPSVAAIASDSSQFKAWEGDLVTAYAPGTPEYEAAGKVVDEVFGKANGVRPPDPTQGATFFYSGDKKPSFWSKGVEEISKIGGHVFGKAMGAFKPKGFTLKETRETAPDPRTAMLQQQLARVGLYKGEVDGRYGPQTKAAVRAWQEREGMRPTGIADVPTLQSLKLPTSEAKFQRALIVNPETPANRSRLFPEDQPISPQEQAVADALGFDIFGAEGRDFTGPSVSRDRLGADRISGGGGQDKVRAGKTTTDRLGADSLDRRFSAVLDKAEAGTSLTDADKATIAEFQEQGGEPNEAIVQRANRVLGEHPNETAWAARQSAQAGGLQHRVAPGDTFGKLAKRYLGDAGRWQEIQAANPGINERSIPIGTPLNIPGVSGPPSPRGRPSTVVDVFGGTDRTGLPLEVFGGPPEAATEIFAGTDRRGTPSPNQDVIERQDAFEAAQQSRFLAREAMRRRQEMEQATTPPTRPRTTSPTRGPDERGELPTRTEIPDETVAAAKRVAGLPQNMNVAGEEAWGENYEEQPTLLTDLGFFDQRPVRGRSPAELSLDAMTERYPTSRSKDDTALPFQRQDSTKRPVTPVLRDDTGLPDQPGYIEALFGPREVPVTGTAAISQTKVDLPSDVRSTQTGGEFMTDTRPPRNDELASNLAERRRYMEAVTRPPAVITEEARPRATARPTSLSLDAMPGSDAAIQPPQDEREPINAFDEIFGISGAQALPFAEVEPTSRFNAKATTSGAVPTRTVEAYDDEDVPAVEGSDEVEAPADPVAAIAVVQNAPIIQKRRETGNYPGAIRSDQAASTLPTSRAAAQATGTSQLPQSRAVYGYQASGGGVSPVTGIAYTTGTVNGRPAIQTSTWTAVQNPDGTYSHGYQ